MYYKVNDAKIKMRSSLLVILISIFSLIIGINNSMGQAYKSQPEAYFRVNALISDFDSLHKIEPERARGLINQALHTSKDNGFKKEYGDSYQRLGKLHLLVGGYDSARYCLEQAMQIYGAINEKTGLTMCYKDLGIISMETGNVEMGLEYYTKGLNFVKQNKIDGFEHLFINNLGTVYLAQGHHEKALEHFQESASLNKKGYHYAVALSNIAFVKQKQGKEDEALKFYTKSLKECTDIKDEYCALIPLNGMINGYLAEEKYDLALETTEKIITTQEKLGLGKDLMVSYNKMGLIYMNTNQYDLAIYYYNKSLTIAKKLKPANLHLIHANLYIAHAENQQFEEALNHAEIFYEMKDSIYNEEYKIRTEELLTKYETKKHEQEIALLKKDRRLKEIEIEKKQAVYTKELLKRNLEEQENKYKLLHKNRQIGFLKKDSELQKAKIENKQNELERETLFRNITIASAILIFIPTFILMVVYQQKVRNKELLALKTEEVNKQKTLELLRTFEIKTIKANLEGQENEKRRLAKELHDGVAGSLAGIKMRFHLLGNLLEENELLKNLMNSVDDVYKEVRTISHHLTPPGMLQYSFVGFIKKYLTDISQPTNFKIEHIYHGEEELNQLSDDVKVEIYRILQELITNALKHSKADLVEVQLIKHSDGVNLIVEDWGKGFDVVSKSAGLGLNSLNSRVDALGGQLNIDSAPKRGTIVNVNIPID